MWSVRPPDAASDEETSVALHEPDVEYTEVVHPQPAHLAKGPPKKKGTDTVYTELQNAPICVAAAAEHEYGSLQYAELNNTHPLISQDNDPHHDLPVPFVHGDILWPDVANDQKPRQKRAETRNPQLTPTRPHPGSWSDIFSQDGRGRVGGGSGAHWVLSTPKALTLESPLLMTMDVASN
ncbi:hypothetical protein N1851_003699 [Merluccius polli]|uniref:Uncharacterized protein n=1 Tax=Merluccius polli TaxID=89951 RepID=A0AA47N9L8_MERPO|nr:hypothetical protein N1851_003699 [Merluccius polli]